VIFAAAFDRMLPEWASYVEPRTRTPLAALLLMVIPSLIISYLYAYNIFSFRTLALDATLVIAVTFLGSAVAGIILPWRSKSVYEGSPIAKYKMPTWLGWLVMLIFVVGGIYLIYISFSYGYTVLTNLAGLDTLTIAMAYVVGILTLANGRDRLAGLLVESVSSVTFDAINHLGSDLLPVLIGYWLVVLIRMLFPFDFAYYAIG
jgi:amino acid transporter